MRHFTFKLIKDVSRDRLQQSSNICGRRVQRTVLSKLLYNGHQTWCTSKGIDFLFCRRRTTCSHYQFETWDTCSLKSDLHLIGTVERTALDFTTHQPLDDFLIVAHSLVHEAVMTRFLLTGVPEKGYIFVAWSDESEGRSLVSEQDLNLISRNLEIGDTVKQNVDDAMVGTVLSISETHTLQPICTTCTHGAVRVHEPIYNRLRSPPVDGQCSSVCRHALLSSVSTLR